MLKATPSKGAWLGLLLASHLPTIPAPSIFRQIAIAVRGELEPPVLASGLGSRAALAAVIASLFPLSSSRGRSTQKPTAPETTTAAATIAPLLTDPMRSGFMFSPVFAWHG
jgi:hypothetical protein